MFSHRRVTVAVHNRGDKPHPSWSTVYQAASAVVLQYILKGVGTKLGALSRNQHLMKDLVHSGNMNVSLASASVYDTA